MYLVHEHSRNRTTFNYTVFLFSFFCSFPNYVWSQFNLLLLIFCKEGKKKHNTWIEWKLIHEPTDYLPYFDWSAIWERGFYFSPQNFYANQFLFLTPFFLYEKSRWFFFLIFMHFIVSLWYGAQASIVSCETIDISNYELNLNPNIY